MIRVHVLTERPTNQNTAAFLAPLVWNAPLLRNSGIAVRLFYGDEPALTECDVVAVNSKLWKGDWGPHKDRALALLDRLRSRRRLLYFDRSSTPGLINADVFPYVDRYLKNAVYRDRSHYLRPVYGARLFAEHYRNTGVTDATAPFTPQALRPEDTARIEVAWNTGLANYSLLGPRLGSLYGSIPVRQLFAPPRRFTPPSTYRPIAVSCRMGVRYRYETVGHQRKRMATLLAAHRRTERVSKFAYGRELRQSRIAASPFGYSEINYKDFEVFLAGGVLLKPDMSHLETWPNYYVAGTTYVAHRWDLADVETQIETILARPDLAMTIAHAGQDAYRHQVRDEAGRAAFAARFASIVGTA